VCGTTFDHCLNNLSEVLQRCENMDFVFNWEKFHFRVHLEAVISHIISTGASKLIRKR